MLLFFRYECSMFKMDKTVKMANIVKTEQSVKTSKTFQVDKLSK